MAEKPKADPELVKLMAESLKSGLTEATNGCSECFAQPVDEEHAVAYLSVLIPAINVDPAFELFRMLRTVAKLALRNPAGYTAAMQMLPAVIAAQDIMQRGAKLEENQDGT